MSIHLSFKFHFIHQNMSSLRMKPYCFFTLTAVLLLSCTHTTCSVRIVSNETTDQDALVSFKTRISSHVSHVLNNWSTHASVCNWIGVSCGLMHRRVTALNFSGFEFEGTVIPHLGNLTFLRSIDLSHNNFTGSIPHELSNLRRLEVISMGYNSLSGEIPSWFGSLGELESVLLQNNSFSGSIPPSLGNNTKLRILNLGYNDLGGNIPQQIGNLSYLETLDLSNGQIRGSIPHSIFNLSRIEMIILDGNSLSGMLPKSMCNDISKLNGLHLSENLLSGRIPFDIYKCSELQILSLSINHFSGSIPSSIGWLTKLRHLYIGINDFQGGIPSSLNNLSNLQNLSIQGASLTGHIPSFIFNISSLVDLDLGNNSLSGTLPSGMCHNLPSLKVLYLNSNQLTGRLWDKVSGCKRISIIGMSENELTGEVPRHVENLTELAALYLDTNYFTGELPAELGNLNLVEINVHNNSLSGTIPFSIFNVSTLEIMDFSYNNFSGELPSTMGLSLPKLQDLYLTNNKLSGVIPSSISNASALTILVLRNNSFVGSVPDFSNLKRLEFLHIARNYLTGEHPNQEMRFLTSLTNCRLLRAFDLFLNPLDGVLPASIGNFSSALQIFAVAECGISGSIPAEIANITNLRDLLLQMNEFTGFIPTTLGRLNQLARLYLYDNKLEGYIPSGICQLSRIGDFVVTDNMLHGPIPTCIGELKSLRSLYLDSNLLESHVPSNLWNLTDLLFLNLSSNILSGSLPLEIGNLKNTVQLDFSSNNFSGDIPSSIDGAQALVDLSLAHNKFQGSIPPSIGNLKVLESLDLSTNNFSGSIPKSLETLRFLQYFNVSYNRLEGQIPLGGNFANFTAQSFLKNHGLCGATRLQVPPCRESHKKSRSKHVVSLMKYILPPFLSAIIVVIVIVLLMRRKRSRAQSPSSEISLLPSWRASSYLELQRATNAFSESNLLGSGSFGTVYIGTLSDGLTVAIKVFNLLSERVTRSFDTEIEVLKAIRHRNLIKIIGCCMSADFKALVYEYMPNGSLEKWLYPHNCFLDLLQRLNIAIDVALALEYLHVGLTAPIVHCDLKPSNILLDGEMTTHVGDFGIAKIVGEEELMTQTKTLATIGYMAPEYGSDGIVSTSADVYSFGIILIEMCTRKKPTDEMFGEEMSLRKWVSLSLDENETMKVVDTNLFREDDQNFSAKEQCLSSILRLAMECVVFSASERIKMSEVVAKLKKIKLCFQQTIKI